MKTKVSVLREKKGKNLSRYTVDFEFAGHITVKAKNADRAIDIVNSMGIGQLKKHIQNFNVGKNYVTKEPE